MSARRGFTLVELLVSMLILGIIGAALTKLFVSQSRLYDQQTQLRQARFVSRAAINAALSDLRMVEVTAGVVSATPRAITARVPYALGVVCANTPLQTTLSLLPVDSTTYATAGFSGYAWRDTRGNYTYVEAGATVGPDDPSLCASANVTVLPAGRVVAVRPPLPAALPPVVAVGTTVLLFQRVVYEFKTSAALPGRTALWRTIVASRQSALMVCRGRSLVYFAAAGVAENVGVCLVVLALSVGTVSVVGQPTSLNSKRTVGCRASRCLASSV